MKTKKIKAICGIQEKAVYSTEMGIQEFRELWINGSLDSYSSKKEAIEAFKKMFRVVYIPESEFDTWRDDRP